MQTVHPRLVAALQRQLQRRHGERVGWKLGIGDRERIGNHIAVGHLTSATRLEPGSSYRPVEGEDLHADAEIAVEIGTDGKIAAYGAALELVDLRSPPNAADDVVAANIFHRAVAFARTRGAQPPDRVEARLLVNGEIRDAGHRSARDIEAKVTAAGEILDAVGEGLEPGDLVITGSVVQVPVVAGDHVEADLGALGHVWLRIGSPG